MLLKTIILMLGLVMVSASLAQTVVTSSKKLSYDIDGNSLIDQNDTMMVIRYLFQFSGSSIIANVVFSSDAIRTSPESITAHLNSLRAVGAFDIDGDGVSDALSDGIILNRYYLGFRRIKIVGDGVVNPVGLRTTDQDIIRYIRRWDF